MQDFCQQAYAWNLDYIVDVHGNSQAFYYTQDTNYYHTKAGTGPTYSYVRASRLARVEYGMRAGSELTAKAPMVVHLGYTGRCEQGTSCATGNDVPYEQFNCPTATNCPVQAPTFYTHYRLWTVISQTLVGSSYGNADVWTLGHSMPNPGDGTRPALWLLSVIHQGADTTTTGLPYTVALADKGWKQACRDDKALALGLNTHGGNVTNAPVAEAHGVASIELADVLG
ncbi:Alanine dehydrogenase [Arthrobacter sp. ZXY-2]|nr:Alanine dehydrogenase [Arthrobacter sp. ZXY-2]